MRQGLLNGVAVLAVVLGIQGCKKEDQLSEQIMPQVPTRQEMDVAYGKEKYQSMDIYFPPDYNETTPVVFLIHGGGFVAGTKEDFTPQAVMMRDNGMIVVNMSYRLVDTTGMFVLPPLHKNSAVTVADQLDDINAGIRLYMKLAPGYKSTTKTMYIAGASAGSILAMLYAFGEYNLDHHIIGCANWCGATDLTIHDDALMANMDPRFIEMYYRCIGAMPDVAHIDVYKKFSPYWEVVKYKSVVPLISILPSNTTVYSNSFDLAFGIRPAEKFHELLAAGGDRQLLHVYEDEVHTFSTHPNSWLDLIAESASFLKKTDRITAY